LCFDVPPGRCAPWRSLAEGDFKPGHNSHIGIGIGIGKAQPAARARPFSYNFYSYKINTNKR
jgi:hypothetical protein